MANSLKSRRSEQRKLKSTGRARRNEVQFSAGVVRAQRRGKVVVGLRRSDSAEAVGQEFEVANLMKFDTENDLTTFLGKVVVAAVLASSWVKAELKSHLGNANGG